MMASTPIALVGIGCRFPGGVIDPSSMWNLLLDAKDVVSEIPGDRVDLAQFFDPSPGTAGKMSTRRGGFLPAIDMFDAAFFGIAPRDAERMDPQHRLLLETAWEALEDAGEDIIGLAGSDTAVFMGQWTSDYENRLFASPARVDFEMTLGTGRYAASGRLSFALGLRGPSLTIDTGCSSGLACVHLAAQSLRRGETRLALAGAANLILQPHIYVAYSQSKMMAADGRCKFGDAAADGYVRSEGVAVLVLKTLDDALAAGDRIHAIIRGTAINNDGRSSGSMGTPGRSGQVELMRRALADAGVNPAQIGYFEAHGTGTRAGDPVELGAMAEVLGERGLQRDRVPVGSVKTNLGHTEGVAGLAGLIKAALVLQHERVPASLHLTTPTPAIPWSEIPLEIPTTERALAFRDGRRIAAVNALGIGGTNAHVVLEAAASPAEAAGHQPGSSRSSLLLLSARSREALRALAARHATALAQPGAPPIPSWCAAAALHRSALEYRAAFVAEDAAGMMAKLSAFADASVGIDTFVDTRSPSEKRVVFVIPGQGGQWPGMGVELLSSNAAFRATLEACDAALLRLWPHGSLLEILRSAASNPATLERIDVVQPALVAMALGYAAALRAIGIQPAAVVGHSLGEVAAACIAGALTIEDAMRIASRRSALMHSVAGQGAMALVELPIEEARSRLAAAGGDVCVAVSQSPNSVVISGRPSDVVGLCDRWTAEGVFCRRVNVEVASHSSQMDPLVPRLVQELAGLRPRQADVDLFSTVTASRERGERLDAAYWGMNLRQTVRFAETVASLQAEGFDTFVELSPHALLSFAIRQTTSAATPQTFAGSCGVRGQPEERSLLGLVGDLWSNGASPDLGKLYGSRAPHLRLPAYPWQRERHWVEHALPAGAVDDGAAGREPSVIARDALHVLRWERAEDAPTPRSAERWLVVSDDASWGTELVAAFQARGTLTRRCTSAELAQIAAADEWDGIVVTVDDTPGAAFRLVRAGQSIAKANRAPPRGFWCATSGSQGIGGREPGKLAIHSASAWGAGRVLADEMPDAWGGLVDLDPGLSTRARAESLVDEVLCGGDEPEVGLRAGSRWRPRLHRANSLPMAPLSYRADSAYLITGGLGALGMRAARTMVANGARHIALMTRSALPPRAEWKSTSADERLAARIASIIELERAGATVHIVEADMADESSVTAALRRFDAESRPPIRGVIHAAGLLSRRLATDHDEESFSATVDPKLGGALCLDRLLPELDFFILYSSMLGIFGSAGASNYAAANAGLDALAATRRARGSHALSILWGFWKDTGLRATGAGVHTLNQFLQRGIREIDPPLGDEIFDAMAGVSESSLVVMPIQLPLPEQSREGMSSHLLDNYRQPISRVQDDAELAQRLASLQPAERRKQVQSIVVAALGMVLKLAPERIDVRMPFGSMGLTSLLSLELRNLLQQRIGRPLSATLTWNYPTVEQLARFLVDGMDVTATRPAPEIASAIPPTLDVDEMTDDDAIELLRKSK